DEWRHPGGSGEIDARAVFSPLDEEPAFYCVVNSTTAIATDRQTADTVAAVDSTPIRRSAAANRMMMGVAVIRPSCASLTVCLRENNGTSTVTLPTAAITEVATAQTARKLPPVCPPTNCDALLRDIACRHRALRRPDVGDGLRAAGKWLGYPRGS